MASRFGFAGLSLARRGMALASVASRTLPAAQTQAPLSRVAGISSPFITRAFATKIGLTPTGEKMTAALRKPAPTFVADAVINGEIGKVDLASYAKAGKYVVLFFYPLDFTFVCPTEIIAFSEAYEKFKAINTEVIGVSVDSVYSHYGWINTPRNAGGIGAINYPLVSDLSREICKSYGVLIPDEHISFRGLFIIDDKGIIRQITMNENGIGRSVDETLRLVQAAQYTDKHGEVCPANWTPGSDAMKGDIVGSKAYFSKHG